MNAGVPARIERGPLAPGTCARHARGMIRTRQGQVGFVLVLATFVFAPSAWAGGDWNDEGIEWRSYEEGLAEAKKSDKPICLVVYTEWCPHCQNYSKVFHDGEIEDAAKQFVMIRLDQDQQKAVTNRYAPDGAYIPRTLFLDSDGVLAPDIKVERKKYVYFYDEHDPAHLRKAMKGAHGKLTKSADPS